MVLTGLLLTACAHAPDGPSGPPDYLSALALPSVGDVLFQPEGLRGQPVVATFFATWCFPCLAQLGLLRELHQAYAAAGLRVVAVGMDLEGRKVLAPFAREQDLPYPILVADEPLRKGETPFGTVGVLPSTVILARDGTVVTAWPGVAAVDEVHAAVRGALK